MKLYIAPGSPNCRKVQAVVHELATPVEVVVIDFSKGEHKAPEYLSINPNGLVPSLARGLATNGDERAQIEARMDALIRRARAEP